MCCQQQNIDVDSRESLVNGKECLNISHEHIKLSAHEVEIGSIVERYPRGL